ncbi:hypothetical protein EK21DRAFT_89613 [Setomelanomma holmii]|uniref:Uncharacterized protein n=1 Tax=Setomelanomma holmii TaxID=210430 RepID=A0A9P4HA46_9PLEO|nr:hypothetical protein EK21DRAFT_89613 [Setomelanomma holmii]
MSTSAKNSSTCDASTTGQHEAHKSQRPQSEHQDHIAHGTSSSGHELLPAYTEDGTDALSEIEQLATSLRTSNSDDLPLTSFPPFTYNVDPQVNERIIFCRRMIEMYFEAIKKADMHIIAAVLELGLVTPETTNSARLTPMLAAVESGKAAVMRLLIDSGADIDAYGVVATSYKDPHRPKTNGRIAIYRTPLQYAAQLGNFTIVKLLIGHGAEDSLIALDGQLALRLAAANAH